MSKVESFAMPPLEMMACGGTVIINKVTGYDEYIVDGYNALVVEQGDVKSARQKLELLMNDKMLLEKLIEGGLETARQWTWEYSNNKLVQTLEGQMEIKWSADAEIKADKKQNI
jgi:glycosyltransferase involved in cell wall biosynthesis